MSIQAGTHQIGPSNGSLKIKTGKEGAAAKMGHDLIIEIGSWEGTVQAGDNPSVTLTADPSSIGAIEGSGGAKALSDKDRADIKKSIGNKVLGSSQITFTSSEVTFEGGSGRAAGDLSLAGKSNQITAPLTVGSDGAVSASVTLSQSDYGIKQFSAMMGALKVKDQVEVVLEAKLPTG